MTVEGAGGGVLDQEIRTISIPDLTAARPAISTPRVYAVRTPREFQAIAGNAAALYQLKREILSAEKKQERARVERIKRIAQARSVNREKPSEHGQNPHD